MNTSGRPRGGKPTPADPVSPDRILLGRLALLSRERNHRAVADLLAEWWARECREVGAQSTHGRGGSVVRDSQWNDDSPAEWTRSDPLNLAIAELDGLDQRLANFLDCELGVLYVRDLAKWRPCDLLAIRNVGPKMFINLQECLQAAGAWEGLCRAKREWRQSEDGC